MELSYAPVALFAYNRPRHLTRVVEALARNAEAKNSALFVFSDAPKTHSDAEQVAAVRAVAKNIHGFRSVQIVEQLENKGVARSVVDGVTEIVETHGRVIVVEDDLVVSSHFLAYMNHALQLYEHDSRVVSIHGYVYPVNAPLPETSFLRGADCWGWATWKRGWDIFESDATLLLERLSQSGLADLFDFNGSYGYTAMLEDQIAGRIDSWAIRWYASAFLANMLTLYPGRSLVTNIGADGSGAHFGSTTDYDVRLTEKPIRLDKLPLEESIEARKLIERYFRSIRPTLLRRLKSRIRKLLSARY